MTSAIQNKEQIEISIKDTSSKPQVVMIPTAERKESEEEKGDIAVGQTQIKSQQTFSDFKAVLRRTDTENVKVETPTGYEGIIEAVNKGHDTKFLINEEYLPLNKKVFNTHKIGNILICTALTIAATILFSLNVHERVKSLQIVGELLFAVGFAPWILSVWSGISGAAKFKTFNFTKAVVSFISASFGLIFLFGAAELDHKNQQNDQGKYQELKVIIALGMMEIAVIFFISRFFFFRDDDELTIQRLENQLQTAREAVGAGLALAYFYNFLKPFCLDLYRDKHTKKVYEKGDRIWINVTEKDEKDNRKGKHHILARHLLTVLIPLNLSDEDLKDQVSNLDFQGRVVKYSSYRQFPVPLLKTWRSTLDDNVYCSGLCDIPTVLSSIYKRKQDIDEQRRALPLDKMDDILPVDIPAQILDFQNNLIQLVRQYEETRHTVRIISIPRIPIDQEECWQMIAKLDGDLKNEFTLNTEGETV